jgi:tRNA dimethylallyltransferase
MAIEIALRLEASIISVDSMQVYRGMNIGTAKPTLIERRGVPHHLIDVVDPQEEFSVAEFRRLGRRVIEGANGPVIITGGSGLHFRALLDPMSFAPTDDEVRALLESMPDQELVAELLEGDPGAGRHVDLANPRRVIRAVEVLRLTGETPSARACTAEAEHLKKYIPEVPFTAIGVDPGERVAERVTARLEEMRSGGLVDEVTALRHRLGRTASSAVGYREVLDYLSGAVDLDQAFAAIAANTRKLAKRQRSWFQRDPRIHWIPWAEDDRARVARAMEILS